ncbi:protein LKAAEAR1-like [Dreissena polymorpha]|uniref:Uncharacterized protein n=1 Tax=Dreissena polymorpha TaxID=45954 RepID=A0A9D4DFB6_DREPO|nr:protein LKAAEAR1-like isoform X1 [Dreissena polymorpha]XP_052235008.1 protein LKAAEAR1-like isoform X2 [Dreissena polymorpha]XP_052235009.1 protein LKAAEAR1-like isoform X3 [Dreissena polymorpha]XP_052235010.1 protein LKAAEAR1-like isoform X4 [Dreissena polymorpha]XP_052235011.1 protein LKAAEAR1-like isoform X5 [Dreissena polymorpha]XP_052237185.1 protein LKAAEAR1-like [Dreissena polymorpha]KAH3748577.1 hypothetical protein DPMN_183023 [Dreissena polymorpha]KAH3753061.1 hypothetical prote
MADEEDGKFKPKNKKKLQEKDLKKMAPQLRSKYLAYEEPSKDVQESQANAAKRLVENKKKLQIKNAPETDEAILEREKHEKLIGQLKAAEARNRLRIMRLRYQSSRAQEINHLIACQPTALKAVRLQALVPAYSDTKDKGDTVEKMDRERIEQLLEDAQGLLTNRIN